MMPSAILKPRRRNCRFNPEWPYRRQFSNWLRPFRGDKHKAYCLLCERSFSVGHGGLHDVRTHRKAKRHLRLEFRTKPSGRVMNGNRERLKLKKMSFFASSGSLHLEDADDDRYDKEACRQVKKF